MTSQSNTMITIKRGSPDQGNLVLDMSKIYETEKRIAETNFW